MHHPVGSLDKQPAADLQAGIEQARTLIAAGDFPAARDTLTTLGERFPDEASVFAWQSEVARRAGDYRQAAAHLARLEELGKMTPALLQARAHLHTHAGDYEAAVADFRSLLQADPQHCDALAGLSFCCFRLKRLEEAQTAAQELLSVKPFALRKARESKGCVLVLEALYLGCFDRLLSGFAIHAPLNVVQTMAPQELDFCHLYVDAPDLEQVLQQLPKIDVIYNNVVNAELAALGSYDAKIRKIARQLGVPVLNRPEAVARTTRRRNYERLSQIPGLVFPTTLEARVPEPERAAGFAEWIAQQVGLPVLVRRIFTHADDDVSVFHDSAALAAWAREKAGAVFYFIRFIESRSPDGLYRKYRAAAINGRFFPVHLFFGRNAIVHRSAKVFRALVAEHPGLIDEVYGFLFALDEVLDGAQMEALQQLIDRVGLDFLGIDFGILPDGTLLIFEANASMMARSFYPEMYDRLADLVRSDAEILNYLERYCLHKVALHEQGAPEAARRTARAATTVGDSALLETIPAGYAIRTPFLIA